MNYEPFKSIKQRHTQCKHIVNHDEHGKHSLVHITRKFVKKGLFVKQGEVVTPKLMVFVKRNIRPSYGE